MEGQGAETFFTWEFDSKGKNNSQGDIWVKEKVVVFIGES